MKYGHKPDTLDPRDFNALRVIGATPPSSAGVDLRGWDPEIWDQGQVGSCVAQSLCAAVLNRGRRKGVLLAKPSALALYAMARIPDAKRDGSGSLVLEDDGCRPRVAAKALKTYGLVREERWPYIESRQGILPPWDVYQHGTDAIVSGFARIVGTGEERIALIQKALAAGYPVPFAQQVDQAFEDYDGSKPLGPFSGAPLGGHMTVIVGDNPKRRVFTVRNSWGESWGLSGYYEMTYERAMTPVCTDFYVVTLTGDDIHIS